MYRSFLIHSSADGIVHVLSCCALLLPGLGEEVFGRMRSRSYGQPRVQPERDFEKLSVVSRDKRGWS